VHRCICVEKKNQLDATECFIALIICSTCFGHFYAHHQELKTIQGVSRLVDITAGGDFPGLYDQKSSHKHVPILDGYGVMTA